MKRANSADGSEAAKRPQCKKATEKLDEHFHGKQFHKLAVEDTMMFTKMQVHVSSQ